MEDLTKKCKGCNTAKPLDKFYKRRASKSLENYCKPCYSLLYSKYTSDEIKKCIRDGNYTPRPKGTFYKARYDSIREDLLTDWRAGLPVSYLSENYGVHRSVIYKWIKSGALDD